MDWRPKRAETRTSARVEQCRRRGPHLAWWTPPTWVCVALVTLAACAQPSPAPDSSTSQQSDPSTTRARKTQWALGPEQATVAAVEREDAASIGEAPVAVPSARSFTVAVVSDLNGSYGSREYGEQVHASVRWIVEELQPDIVVSTGDMVAGQKQGLAYEAMWSGFHAAVTDPLASAGIPLAVTPGNHDASAGAYYARERVEYIEQWRQRRPDIQFVDDRFYPLHYAFEAGGALFVSLDATITGPIDRHQRAWLESVLSEHSDYETKIVFGHVPLHPFSEERRTETLNDAELERLLVEHGVDVMATGHHHAYFPGKRGGLRLLGMACLGGGRRTLIGTDDQSQRSVAVIRIATNGSLDIEAYRPNGRVVERSELPRQLNAGQRRIWRDDVRVVSTR